MHPADPTLPADEAHTASAMPEVIDNVAVARLYGEPLFAMPQDLYIPVSYTHLTLPTICSV